MKKVKKLTAIPANSTITNGFGTIDYYERSPSLPWYILIMCGEGFIFCL